MKRILPCASLPRLRLLLSKPNVYYHDVPTETGRFTKDAALLAEVQRITNERMELASDLSLAVEINKGLCLTFCSIFVRLNPSNLN